MKIRRKEFIACVFLAFSVVWIDFLSVVAWRTLHFYHVKYFHQRIPKDIDHSSGLSISEPLLNILNCSDASQKPRIERRQGFYLYYNYIRSTKYFRCHESVTFATYLKPGFLDNLERFVEAWRGPVSVSVMVLKTNYEDIMERIIHLRECESSLVKDFVSFHFIFNHSDFPDTVFMPNEIAIYFKNICKMYYPRVQYSKENKQMFVNFGLNVAIEGSLTHFFVCSELYLQPSRGFISKFLNFLHRVPEEIFEQKQQSEDVLPLRFPNLFVLPVFIIKKGKSLPQNKAELLRLRLKKEAALFSTDSSPFNQHFGKYDRWVVMEEDERLDIVSSGKTRQFLHDWEPVYVGNKLEPFYDERLVMEGPHSKYAKYVEVCSAGYIYKVLDEAYLLLKEEHAPYYRPEQLQEQTDKDYEEQFQNEINTLREILKELRTVYGNTLCFDLQLKKF